MGAPRWRPGRDHRTRLDWRSRQHLLCTIGDLADREHLLISVIAAMVNRRGALADRADFYCINRLNRMQQAQTMDKSTVPSPNPAGIR